ncbi:short-chain dehydrogenase/reductase 2b-like [Solanum pennellii]|uniref:Short-chain dehydrogenase/reductase 2b-like n=1 Tax=Solanum pennellii TaxID=28526 RepID=A0ABM1FJ46_SOLPN|nr:short-chain dehydrogenase/reductase 2b-like [Solanum pennellii]
MRKELGDIENLTEDRIDEILHKFLNDLKQDSLEITKVSEMCINCVHPGFVNTDLSWHRGTMPVEEGAEESVMLAILPDGGPTGCYCDRTVVNEF